MQRISELEQNNTADWAPTPISTSFGAEEIGWQALGPATACTILATTVVTLRWYTRCRLAHCLGLDDIVILFSILLAWSMCGIIGAEVHEGLGVYQGGRPVDAQHLAKLVIVNNNLWAVAVNVTKASIIAQYLRIFSSRTTRSCCYVLLVFLVPAVCWSVLGGTFLCRPIEKLWDPRLPGECMDPRTYWLSAAGLNIGIDFTVLLLPLPAISKLRLPRKQKIYLVLMFLLGFYVCVVSVVRLATVYSLERSGRLVESGIQAVTWSAIEVNIGIVCASLIALKPLLAHFCPCMLDEADTSKHCMRLSMVQTLPDNDNIFCASNSDSVSPTTPTSPSLARITSSTPMLHRPSFVTTLPGIPQRDSFNVLGGLFGNDLASDGQENGKNTH